MTSRRLARQWTQSSFSLSRPKRNRKYETSQTVINGETVVGSAGGILTGLVITSFLVGPRSVGRTLYDLCVDGPDGKDTPDHAARIQPVTCRISQNTFMIDRLRYVLRPVDTVDSPGSRSHSRYRRAGLTAIASLVSLGANGLVGLLSVPLMAKHLGTELYGVWLTLSSTLSWISLANLGSPQGLQNALAECIAKEDSRTARVLISTTMAAAFVLAGVLLILAGVATPLINWARVFNLPPALKANSPILAIGLALGVTALNVPLSTFRVVYLAHQEGYIASSFDAAKVVLSLGLLVIAVRVSSGMSAIVLAVYGTALFVTVVSLIWMFAKQFPALRPSIKLIRFKSLRRIARTSTSVFGIAIIVMLITTGGNLILTQTAGPSQVPAFALPAMIFALARGIGASVSGSPGAAYTEAAARGEWRWIHGARIRIRVFVGSVMTFFVVTMTIAGPRIIEIWSRGQVHADRLVIVLLGIHSALWVTLGGEANVVNNVDMAHKLVAPALSEGVLFIALAVVMAPRYGAAGIAGAMLIGFVLTNAWYIPRQVSIAIREGMRNDETRMRAAAR